MDLLSWMEEFWKDSRKYNPLAKPIEKMVQRDSQNVARIGNALGWDWLEQEAKKNADDPVRGVARASLTAGGIFAAPYVASAVGGGGMGSGATGMFAQTPGVTAGSQQAAMLAAQNAGFGGAGADLTAQAAMSAIKDAYAAGKIGTMDYLGNVLTADMAGMNDPAVWGDRLSRNAGRIAGNVGKSMAMSALAPRQQPPAPPPPPQQPPQQTLPPEIASLVARAKAGDLMAIEELKRLGIDARSI